MDRWTLEQGAEMNELAKQMSFSIKKNVHSIGHIGFVFYKCMFS